VVQILSGNSVASGRGSLIAAFALLGAALISILLLVAGAERANDWVDHTLEVRRVNAEILSDIERIAAARRGYLLDRTAGREEFVEEAAREAERELAGLAELIADSPQQAARLSRLRNMAQFQIDLGRGTISGARSRTRAEVSAELLAGSQNLRAIRAESAAFDRFEEQLLFERQRSASWLRRLLLAASFLALFGAGLLMSFVFRRWNQHVASLQASVEALREEIAYRERTELQLGQAQKMEALGQLVGGVAHDFNNMLAVIVGGLDLWLKREGPDAPRRSLVENALEAARRAATLTGRLLAFSRQQPLSPVVLDVNRVTREMSELLRQSIGEQVQLEAVLSGGLWLANVDRNQLESGHPQSRRQRPRRNGRARRQADHRDRQHLSRRILRPAASGSRAGPVRDDRHHRHRTGHEPRDHAQGVRSLFHHQAARAGNGPRPQPGAWLRAAVRGHVKLYSEPGVGTSVKIYLPRNNDGLAPAEETARQRSTAPREHCVVLVVEDEDGVRAFVAEALRELGCEPVKAASGGEAMALLAVRADIALLLTDVVMPQMTGSALAKSALEMRPDLKVLYMTGYTRNAIVHNGVLDAGVKLLSKPFTIDQLDDALEAALR
jgi:CheY-like chemotaxis protein/CHASE3 domain sensor protein